MTQDNAYAYAQFSAIGGHDHQGECAWTLRIFASYEAAVDYARDLCDEGFDYVYVMGIGPDGVPNLAEVTRVADTEPSLVNLS